MQAWRRSVVEPTSDSGAEPCTTPGDLVLLAGEALAGISGFSFRARSLLCKCQIGRRTARSERVGRRAEFRRMAAAGRAVLKSMSDAVSGLKSRSQRGGILPGSRLSRSVFRMVFTILLWRASRAAPSTNPAAGRERMGRASGPRRTRESRHRNWLRFRPGPRLPPFALTLANRGGLFWGE